METIPYTIKIHISYHRFQSLQKIRTDGALDWEFFVIGTGLRREYFLVVANNVRILPNGQRTYEVESVIYKWNWNLFVPFQCIKTNGAKKWTALVGMSIILIRVAILALCWPLANESPSLSAMGLKEEKQL